MNFHFNLRYLIRAIKYFVYFWVVLALIIFILIFIGAAEADISTIFRDGWNSLWKIALMLAAVSAVYPGVGFIKRDAAAPGNWEENKDTIIREMESRHYMLERDMGSALTFRHAGFASKLTRMFEDRITMTPAFGGIEIEGPRKDVLRVAAWIEYAFRTPDSEEE